MVKQTKAKDLPVAQIPFSPPPKTQTYDKSHSELDKTTGFESKINPSDKRVGFLDSVQYSDPPTTLFDDEQIQPVILPTPPSANLQPRKGILKRRNGPVCPSLFNMLASFLKALAGKEVYSRIDAYINLSNVIRAYDNMPDAESLKINMLELCQYIERDLTAVQDDGKPNSNLISLALTLVSSLQFNPAVAEFFPIKFRIRLVEYAITVLEEPSMPRDVMKNVIFVMANQNFSSKVMTPERGGRLIKALHSIGECIKVKSIIIGRIEIYQNLLKRSKSLMTIHTAWVEDVLCDMNSSIKSVENSAIKFGFEAAIKIGAECSVSTAFCTLFKSKFKNDELYGVVYTRMLTKKFKQEHAELVPQIWSILILLQRHRPQILAHSPFLKPLLAVLALGFNHKNIQAQKESQYAWNRFIFAIQLNENTPKSIREMLIRPYIQSLAHQKSNRILESVFNLLYYAFRPGCSVAQLDLYWDEFVKVLVLQSLRPNELDIEINRKNSGVATQILINIFDVNTLRKWSMDRAVQSLAINDIAANELPALDPRWLRKSSSKVLPILFSIFDRLFWDFSDPVSPAIKVLENYVTSIALPAIIEVKVSMETMSCIAGVIGFLYQRWITGITCSKSLPSPNRYQRVQEYLQSFQTIISTIISGLGTLVFKEKLLDFSQGSFTPLAMQHQQSIKTSLCRSPIQHLISIFSKPCPGMEYGSSFSQTIDHILKPFFEIPNSLTQKMVLIMELCAFHSEENSLIPSQIIWEVLSSYVMASINLLDSNQNIVGGQPPVDDYFEIVKFLEIGIKISPNQPLPTWCQLLNSLSSSVALQIGSTEIAPIILEPICKALLGVSHGISYVNLLISKAEYPIDSQEPKPVFNKIRGAFKTSQEITSVDTYRKFYDILNVSLKSAYYSNDENENIIINTNSFLMRCSNQLALETLYCIQDSICIWIIDKMSKLNSESQGQAITLLWSTINTKLGQILESCDQEKILQNLECLICSGLESKHLNLVKISVQTCNLIFGKFVDGFEDYERIKVALLNLKIIVPDKSLAFLFNRESLNKGTENLKILEHLDNQYHNEKNSEDKRPSVQMKPQSPSSNFNSSQLSTPQVVIEVDNFSESFENNTNEKLRRQSVPIVLRNNSQISFASIEESPLTENFYDTQVLKENQTNLQREEETNVSPESDLSIELYRKSMNTSIQKDFILSDQTDKSAVLTQKRPVISEENGNLSSFLTSTSSTCEISEKVDPFSSLPERNQYISIEVSSATLKESQIPSSPPTQEPTDCSLKSSDNNEEPSISDLTSQKAACLTQLSQESCTQVSITESDTTLNDSSILPSSVNVKSKSNRSSPYLTRKKTRKMVNQKAQDASKPCIPEDQVDKLSLPSNDFNSSRSIDKFSHSPLIPKDKFLKSNTNSPRTEKISEEKDSEALATGNTIRDIQISNENENENLCVEHSSGHDVTEPKSSILKITSSPTPIRFDIHYSSSLKPSILTTASESSSPCLKLSKSNIMQSVEVDHNKSSFLPKSKAKLVETNENKPFRVTRSVTKKLIHKMSPIEQSPLKSINETPQRSNKHLSLLETSSVSPLSLESSYLMNEKNQNVENYPTKFVNVGLSFNRSSERKRNSRATMGKRKAVSDCEEVNSDRDHVNHMITRQLRPSKRRKLAKAQIEDSLHEANVNNVNRGISVDLDAPNEFGKSQVLESNSDNIVNPEEKIIQDAGLLIGLKTDFLTRQDRRTSAKQKYPTNIKISGESCDETHVVHLKNNDEQSYLDLNSTNTSTQITPETPRNDEKDWSPEIIVDESNEDFGTGNNMKRLNGVYIGKIKSKFSELRGISERSEVALSPLSEDTTYQEAFTSKSTFSTCQRILETIDTLISALQTADLEKQDVGTIEDRMMDAKRELYEAERRGRSARNN